ncbi:hypothetical protein [Streptomyces aureus]|uniref:hypothetical protein n=1 Tax=Streptomyces aureus TaxID=193461 RepID=UPI003692CF5F
MLTNTLPATQGLHLGDAFETLSGQVSLGTPDVGAVAVLGLGYVGLPTALGLLAAGTEVIGIDASPERLAAIRGGDVDLLPSDLERLSQFDDDPRFTLTDDPAALARARTVLVCVPTPVDQHLAPDLRALRAAAATVVEHAGAAPRAGAVAGRSGRSASCSAHSLSPSWWRRAPRASSATSAAST